MRKALKGNNRAGGDVKQKSKKKNKVVAYLDGDGALPATEKDLKKWIKKFLPAKDKNAKGKGS
jgi:hypothetical protein